MHRAIAGWLTERSWHAALACAACGALSPQMLLPFMVLAAAIPVLVALRFDIGTGLGVALAGAAAATWVVLALAQPTLWILAAIALLFFGPVLLASLLKRGGSLNLCFQIAVLGAAVGLIAVHLALPDPAAVWVDLLRRVLRTMTAAGFNIAGDQNALVALWSQTMWGALAALILATVLGALFLGRWWLTLLDAPGQFGAEYRSLRLGMVLGIAVTVIFLALLWTESALIGSLAWVAFMALSFQGLAAAHRSKAGGRLSKGWLVAIYVLLIVSSVTVLVLAIWGFADNWRRPRAHAA